MSIPPKRHPPRRGFALLVVIALLWIIGATLAVMAVSFAGEVRRTEFDRSQAQLRQLLIAGEAIAQAHLANHSTTQPVNVALPTKLAADGGKLMISGTANQIRIEAELNGHRAGQTVSFAQTPAGRKITNVQLDR